MGGLCIIRGGGDLATGIAWRLTRSGWAVIVTELDRPLTVRRTVSLSSAVVDGTVDVEGMVGRLTTVSEAAAVARSGQVAVLISPELPRFDSALDGGVVAVVDARLAKRNIDTTLADALVVVGVGPGFTVGVDCHVVIETQRGPRLGRVLYEGSAAPDTGTPGIVDGRGAERVLRSPGAGEVRWSRAIGDLVQCGERLGMVGDAEVCAPFDGVVRGLILDRMSVRQGLKIGDIDPRLDVSCHEISDKALAIGGGVVEAVGWLSPPWS